VIKEKYNEKEYYQGQMIEYRGVNGTTTLTIIRIITMPCSPNGRNEMFPTGKVFLCQFQNLPFVNEDGILSMISGYTIIGDDPWERLVDWVESPPEWVDEEWNESDLLSKTAEEAVTKKIEDLEEIWAWTSLQTSCQSCEKKGEQCKKQLRSLLNKTSFSFSLFSNPGAPKTYMGWKKEEIT